MYILRPFFISFGIIAEFYTVIKKQVSMWMICKKEWAQYFNSITGYLSITFFLLINGLYLFVLPDSNLLTFGYADLTPFFTAAPFILLFFVPTVTMRTIAEEKKQGTLEVLASLPLTTLDIILGKFLGSFLVSITVLIPTFTYAVTLNSLSSVGGIDFGAVFGSYIGLILLMAVFAAMGILMSAVTQNAVIALLSTCFVLLFLYAGLHALSKFTVLPGFLALFIDNLGIQAHYKSMSRGVIKLTDVFYFVALTALLLNFSRYYFKKIFQ